MDGLRCFCDCLVNVPRENHLAVKLREGDRYDVLKLSRFMQGQEGVLEQGISFFFFF